MKNTWIDSRDASPDRDGTYLICTCYGDVDAVRYTTDGGWNTHRNEDGTLSDGYALGTDYIAQWFDHPSPRLKA